MSVVTNVILSTPYFTYEYEEEAEKTINSFFGENKGFISCKDKSLPDGWYGGTKYLECNLWLGAFNHLDTDDLVEHLRSIDWVKLCGDNDDDVYPKPQLILKEQDDEEFRIINIT